MMKIKKKDVFWLGLTFLASLLPAILLFKKGFIISDDGDLMLIRLGATIRAIRDFHFPIRILDLNHGNGYPVLNFLYPLPFYTASLIYFISGIGLINSYKLLSLFTLVISAVGAYLLAKKISKNGFIAFISSCFYLITPARMINLYYRSSIGELLASSFSPFVFLFIYQKSYYLLALSLLLIILSHNVLALIMVGIVIILNFLIWKDKKIYLATFLSILLSSFFSLPALLERKYTHATQISLSNVEDRLISLKSFILNSFQLSFDDLSRIENIFFLGLPALFLISLAIYLLAKKKLKKEGKVFLILSFLVILLTLSFCLPLWQSVFKPFIGLIQFPWRLFNLLDLLLLILLIRVLNLFKKNKNIIRIKTISFIFLGLIVLTSIKFKQLVRYKTVDDMFYFTNQSTSTTQDEFTPIWVKEFPKERPDEKVEILKGQAKINNLITKTSRISFNVNVKEDSLIKVNQHYFPGWKLYINNQEEDIDYKEDGLIKFTIKPGENFVDLKFKETRLRFLANLTSLLSLLFLATPFLARIKKRLKSR